MINNVKNKKDNNNWVRDVLKDTDPYEASIRKRTETRRNNALKKKEAKVTVTINYDNIMTELLWGTDVYNGKSPTHEQFVNSNSKYNKQLKKLGRL
jgi:hypothetical protein